MQVSILRLLFVLFLSFGVFSAFADTVPRPVNNKYIANLNGYSFPQFPQDSYTIPYATNFCNQYMGANFISAGSPVYQVKSYGADSECGYWQNSTFYLTGVSFSLKLTNIATCPANSTLQTPDASVCTCNDGTTAQNGSCVSTPVCKAPFVYDAATNGCTQPCNRVSGKPGDGITVTIPLTSRLTAAQLVAMSGRTIYSNAMTAESPYMCETKGVARDCGMFSGPGGYMLACTLDNYHFTGNPEYKGDLNAPPPVIENDTSLRDALKDGKCPGTVNGLTVYAPCSGSSSSSTSSSTNGAGATTASSSSSSSTTSNADGSTSTFNTSTKGNADGSSTTTEFSCTGSNCFTITTTKDSQGNVTDTTKAEGKKEDICTQNPDLAMCKKTSFSESACGSPPVCEGDAVQCAIAKKQHESSCDFKKQFEGTGTFFSDKGTEAANGQDKPEGHPGANLEASTFSLSNLLDQSDGLGGGCPSDSVVSVGGATVVIPWSQTCGALQAVGALAVAVSLLAAAMIVFRS
jgi:hypothetical protein